MTAQQIPLVNLSWQHAEVADDVRDGFARVMDATAFTDGPDVAAFEAEFSAFSGAAHTIGCASGTDALEIALRARDIGPGDEVLVPANTFAATAEAVLRVGALPVFVDVDPDYLLLDGQAAKAAVTARTRAILPVHLYGQMAPMAPVLELASAHDLVVIADAAQCQGATAEGRPIGADAAAAATSFYPGKNLGAYGDAGAIVTDDADLADVMRSIAHHGAGENRYHHVRMGFTSRLDTLQAVVLRAKLARLAGWNDLRRAAAARYDELLAGVEGIVRPATVPGNAHVWHLYVVRVDERDRVLDGVRAAGVGAGVHYPIALPDQPAYAALAPVRAETPVADRAAATVLSLPLFPGITEAQQERVVEVLRAEVAATR